MDELAKGIGSAIGSMPPLVAAVVILAVCVAILVYLWRKGGDELGRERAAAQNGIEGQLKRIGDGQDELFDQVKEVRDGVLLLLDRGKR